METIDDVPPNGEKGGNALLTDQQKKQRAPRLDGALMTGKQKQKERRKTTAGEVTAKLADASAKAAALAAADNNATITHFYGLNQRGSNGNGGSSSSNNTANTETTSIAKDGVEKESNKHDGIDKTSDKTASDDKHDGVEKTSDKTASANNNEKGRGRTEKQEISTLVALLRSITTSLPHLDEDGFVYIKEGETNSRKIILK